MRRLLRFPRVVLILCCCLVSLAAKPAAGAPDEARVDDLLARLAAAGSAAEAAETEARIWSIWREAPDAEAGALLGRAEEAIGRRDYPAALDALDALVLRSPGFAEAWRQRAAVHHLIGDQRAALADLRRVLALEPRHFGALSNLGLVLAALDRPHQAVRAFEAALAIHPFLPGARAHVGMLRGEGGDGLAL